MYTTLKIYDPIWMRNLVITGNVINSGVNATLALFHITSTEGAVIMHNIMNNNGCPGRPGPGMQAKTKPRRRKPPRTALPERYIPKRYPNATNKRK